jgi:23S rRNA (adenine2503-C2)-methyltransferase
VKKATLEAVRRRACMRAPEIVERRLAADGFMKYALRLHDGARIEAVWIPLDRPRASVCLSSQAGCQLRCSFCFTGRTGFRRNLTADEIVSQFLAIRAESPRPVTGAVFMGMGEPFLNYDAVIRAATILSTPGGAGIAAKAISISTAGVVPAIRRYTAEGHRFRLIVSLTAATPEKRAALMPHEAAWPLDQLVDAIRAHAAARRVRVPVAWVMIRGLNTAPEDARALARLFRDVPIVVNLIDVSDPEGELRAPDDGERRAFQAELTAALGQPVVRRYSGGEEIGASCGRLA